MTAWNITHGYFHAISLKNLINRFQRMSIITQKQIDDLITDIYRAVDPESVTNKMVADIFSFLNDIAKSLAADLAGAQNDIGSNNNEISDLRTKLTALTTQFNTLLSGNASDAIDSFNEIETFLSGLKDSDRLVDKLAELRNQITANTTSMSQVRTRMTAAETAIEQLSQSCGLREFHGIRQTLLEGEEIISLKMHGKVYFIESEHAFYKAVKTTPIAVGSWEPAGDEYNFNALANPAVEGCRSGKTARPGYYVLRNDNEASLYKVTNQEDNNATIEKIEFGNGATAPADPTSAIFFIEKDLDSIISEGLWAEGFLYLDFYTLKIVKAVLDRDDPVNQCKFEDAGDMYNLDYEDGSWYGFEEGPGRYFKVNKLYWLFDMENSILLPALFVGSEGTLELVPVPVECGNGEGSGGGSTTIVEATELPITVNGSNISDWNTKDDFSIGIVGSTGDLRQRILDIINPFFQSDSSANYVHSVCSIKLGFKDNAEFMPRRLLSFVYKPAEGHESEQIGSYGNLVIFEGTFYLADIVFYGVGYGYFSWASVDFHRLTATSGSTGSTAQAYTLPAATSSALGGIRTGYTQSGKNYPVQLGSEDRAYVNVPWTDTKYTLPKAGTTLGGIKTGYTANGRNFPVKLDVNDRAYVTVPAESQEPIEIECYDIGHDFNADSTYLELNVGTEMSADDFSCFAPIVAQAFSEQGYFKANVKSFVWDDVNSSEGVYAELFNEQLEFTLAASQNAVFSKPAIVMSDKVVESDGVVMYAAQFLIGLEAPLSQDIGFVILRLYKINAETGAGASGGESSNGSAADLNAFLNSVKGKPNGLATLDASGKLKGSQLPALKTINGKSILGSGNISINQESMPSFVFCGLPIEMIVEEGLWTEGMCYLDPEKALVYRAVYVDGEDGEKQEGFEDAGDSYNGPNVETVATAADDEMSVRCVKTHCPFWMLVYDFASFNIAPVYLTFDSFGSIVFNTIELYQTKYDYASVECLAQNQSIDEFDGEIWNSNIHKSGSNSLDWSCFNIIKSYREHGVGFHVLMDIKFWTTNKGQTAEKIAVKLLDNIPMVFVAGSGNTIVSENNIVTILGKVYQATVTIYLNSNSGQISGANLSLRRICGSTSASSSGAEFTTQDSLKLGGIETGATKDEAISSAEIFLVFNETWELEPIPTIE